MYGAPFLFECFNQNVAPCDNISQILNSNFLKYVKLIELGENTLGWTKMANRDSPFLVHYEVKYIRKV